MLKAVTRKEKYGKKVRECTREVSEQASIAGQRARDRDQCANQTERHSLLMRHCYLSYQMYLVVEGKNTHPCHIVGILICN